MTKQLRNGIFTLGLILLAFAFALLFGRTTDVKAADSSDMGIIGVSVKYDETGENVSGLRFVGHIKKILVDGIGGIEYGMLFLPKQLYVNDAGLNYGDVGLGRVAKADCTGRIESDGDYYNIAVYLSGIDSKNYNCDYYALVYIKNGANCQYSSSKHASISETAKYLLDNGLDVDHENLLKEFILRYPVTIYGYNDAELNTVYVSYGDTLESGAIPEGKNIIDGYNGYIFEKYVTTSGGNDTFDDSEPIKGTTKVYSKYDGGHAGVALKDVNMGADDCGTIDISCEGGSLITTGSSSHQWNGMLSFSNYVWDNYLTNQTSGNKIMAMDIKFSGTVSLSGYVQPTKDSLNINQLRTRTDYFRFYNGDSLVAYNNLAIDTWYKLEIDINAIKNFVGEQSWNGTRSGMVFARESAGTISIKNLTFVDKYDLTGYKYSSVTNFDDAEYNTDEWYSKSTRNTDGIGLYATEEASGNGFLYFDGAAINSTFGTKQKHKNFELSFDVYGAKTDNSAAINGANSDKTSDLRISFGNGTGSVSDRINTDAAISNSVNVVLYQDGANSSVTRVRIYDTGTAIASVKVPTKYGVFSNGYSGKNCRIMVKVSDGKVSVSIKHVDEKNYTTLIDQYSMKDSTMTGYVIFRGYGNQFTQNRTVHQSTHCKIDNIVLGDLTTAMSVPNTPNSLNPPDEVVYTPRDNDYLNYPTQTAH